VRLESHWVDLDAGTLRDAEGVLLTLRPQAWAVLRQLVLHRGQVIGKERLLAAVWPGLVVTDNSVAQAVKDLRQVLGATGQRLIKTVARRGYLLLDAAGPGHDAALPPQHKPCSAVPPTSMRCSRCCSATASSRWSGPVASARQRWRWQPPMPARRRAKTSPPGSTSPVSVRLRWCRRRSARAGVAGCTVRRPRSPAMLAALRPVQALVVLDNAEHFVDALAPLLRRIIDAAPGLHLLVTSQFMLRLEGEHVLRLATLALARDRCGARRGRGDPPPSPCSSTASGRSTTASSSPSTTWPRFRACAAGWTVCRWRSAWPPPACRCWAWTEPIPGSASD
jgi:hypothetical protein